MQAKGYFCLMRLKIPPYLKKGDCIGLVCPAGAMSRKKAVECIRVIKEVWGYEVKQGKTLGSGAGYFSGTDQERLDDLQRMIDDDEIKAILCARGGYGTGRIIDVIDFSKFRKKPKWIIGFSDITVLHAHIHSTYGIATLHAPMANAFNNGGYNNVYVKSLKDALEGKRAQYKTASKKYNRSGKGNGQLIGGNLAIITHLIGTPSSYQTKGKILFLEDVGELKYNIDRMVYQLKRSGMLKDLSGLVIGGFTDTKDTSKPFGKSVEEIFTDAVKEYDYPVCFDFPVSHSKENLALKVGARFELKVTQKNVYLNEI
ncbi:MAG: S66 peptidase family protein [Chitinophagaceae bacterium]